MTSETLPTNTLKFPFGETPEEVIVRQIDADINDRLNNVSAPYKIGTVPLLFTPDELLTVLNALKDADHLNRYETVPYADADERADRMRDLRITILAARGIDESEGGE